MTKALTMIKSSIAALSIAVLSACGGGGDVDVVVIADQEHYFLSVDNLNVGNGVVCINNMYYDANSPSGQQVARDLVDYYKTYDFSRPSYAYSAPTYCGGETSNYVPYPGLIIDSSYYYDVILPWVLANR